MGDSKFGQNSFHPLSLSLLFVTAHSLTVCSIRCEDRTGFQPGGRGQPVIEATEIAWAIAHYDITSKNPGSLNFNHERKHSSDDRSTNLKYDGNPKYVQVYLSNF